MRARAIYTQSLKDGAPGELPAALKLLIADGPVDVVINTLSFAIGEQRLEIGDRRLGQDSAQSPISYL